MKAAEYQTSELRRKNVRLAWALAGVALFFLFTSFPFWAGLFQLLGSQGGQ
jgi:hypothetical protein